MSGEVLKRGNFASVMVSFFYIFYLYYIIYFTFYIWVVSVWIRTLFTNYSYILLNTQGIDCFVLVLSSLSSTISFILFSFSSPSTPLYSLLTINRLWRFDLVRAPLLWYFGCVISINICEYVLLIIIHQLNYYYNC